MTFFNRLAPEVGFTPKPVSARVETPREHVANCLQILSAPHFPVHDPKYVAIEAADLDAIRIRLTEALRQLDAR